MTSRTHTATLNGTIIGSGSADVKAKILALQAAFDVVNQDLVMYLEDDATESTVVLKSAGSLYGVQVIKPPSFPTTFGVENLTKRRWTAVLEASYPVSYVGDYVVAFRESVSMSGGEPRYVFHEDINGLEPLLEITVPRTTYRAVQSGQAVGYLAYPQAPGPLYSGPGVAVVSEVSEQGSEDGVRNWTVSWTHTMESARPLRGRHPHYWITGGYRGA